MIDWKAVFGSYINSGVYVIKPGPDVRIIKKAAFTLGLDYFYIDLKGIKSKADFLKKVATVLNFPDYFGRNWDALGDCLMDLSWEPAAGYVLLFDNFHLFAGSDVADVKVVRHIFDSSVEYWKQKTVPFYIILSENRSINQSKNLTL